MQREQSSRLIEAVTAFVAGKPLTAQLEHELNAAFPASGARFQEIFAAARLGPFPDHVSRDIREQQAAP